MGDEDNINDNLSGDELEEVKRMKKMVLIETITSRCVSSSHEILQRINCVLSFGDGLALRTKWIEFVANRAMI